MGQVCAASAVWMAEDVMFGRGNIKTLPPQVQCGLHAGRQLLREERGTVRGRGGWRRRRGLVSPGMILVINVRVLDGELDSF